MYIIDKTPSILGKREARNQVTDSEINLYLAKDKRSNMHSFVRSTSEKLLSGEVFSPPADAVNDLLMSRSIESLANAAERLGPMFRRGKDYEHRLMRGGRPRLLPSNSEDLLWECFFDPYATRVESGSPAFERSGNTARRAAARVIESRDFCKCEGDDPTPDGRPDLIVEPLQDWVLLRNLISVALRLGGTLRTTKSRDTLLEDVGFSKMGRRTLMSKLATDSPGFALPVMFNPFFRGGASRDGAKKLQNITFDAKATWPLYLSITEIKSRYLGLANVASLRGCDSIKFVTGPQAEAPDGSFEPIETRPEESRWMYLVIEDRDGSSQAELADMLLNALERQLYRPHLSCVGVSMAEVAVESYDLPTALWGMVREHPGHYLLTCENCRRTIFATNQGPDRRFCSDACRITWKRRHGSLANETGGE